MRIPKKIIHALKTGFRFVAAVIPWARAFVKLTPTIVDDAAVEVLGALVELTQQVQELEPEVSKQLQPKIDRAVQAADKLVRLGRA